MKTIVNLILDKSGSMSPGWDDTVGGINSYIKSLKSKLHGKVYFTLTLFDTHIEKVYQAVSLKQVKPLNKDTYFPDGFTALYDAVVETIEDTCEKIKEFKDEKVNSLVVIMTDGQENSSVKHDLNCLRDLTTKLQKEERWTFVYLGANQDSWANASSFGMLADNTANWDSMSQIGITNSFRNLAARTVSYCMTSDTGKGNSTNFFAGEKDISK